MARLTRKNIKVFAGSATNNGVFGSLQANNPVTTNDVEQLQSLSAWEQGWNSATMTSEELPPLEEIQGVTYVTTYEQAYIMQEGLPEWASTVTYYKGSLVKEVTANGFRIYCSLTDNNTGNVLTDTGNWKKVMDSEDLYAFDSTVVHKTGAETVAGVKTFSSSPEVPTATAGDSSAKSASTEFVTTADSALQTQIDAKATPANITSAINTLLGNLYPVGSIYIGTQSTCPLSSLIPGSTWTKISGDKVLQSSSSSHSANSTISAGLPNITGTFAARDGFLSQSPRSVNFNSASGAFSLNSEERSYGTWDSQRTVSGGKSVSFSANKSNSIYGNSSTVQPPAYVVNVWRRTA